MSTTYSIENAYFCAFPSFLPTSSSPPPYLSTSPTPLSLTTSSHSTLPPLTPPHPLHLPTPPQSTIPPQPGVTESRGNVFPPFPDPSRLAFWNFRPIRGRHRERRTNQRPPSLFSSVSDHAQSNFSFVFRASSSSFSSSSSSFSSSSFSPPHYGSECNKTQRK